MAKLSKKHLSADENLVTRAQKEWQMGGHFSVNADYDVDATEFVIEIAKLGFFGYYPIIQSATMAGEKIRRKNK